MAKKKVTKKEIIEDSVSKPSRDDEANGVDGLHTSKKTTRKRKVQVEDDQDNEVPAPAKRSRKRILKVEEEEQEVVGLASADEVVEKKVKKKRKTKEEKAAEAMPIASRSIGHKLFIGAHVSSAGGQYRRG
jgi:AP endonuclease-1